MKKYFEILFIFTAATVLCLQSYIISNQTEEIVLLSERNMHAYHVIDYYEALMEEGIAAMSDSHWAYLEMLKERDMFECNYEEGLMDIKYLLKRLHECEGIEE